MCYRTMKIETFKDWKNVPIFSMNYMGRWFLDTVNVTQTFLNFRVQCKLRYYNFYRKRHIMDKDSEKICKSIERILAKYVAVAFKKLAHLYSKIIGLWFYQDFSEFLIFCIVYTISSTVNYVYKSQIQLSLQWTLIKSLKKILIQIQWILTSCYSLWRLHIRCKHQSVSRRELKKSSKGMN